MHVAVIIAHICLRAAVPCYIETPSNSVLWRAAPLQNLIGKPGCGENLWGNGGEKELG